MFPWVSFFVFAFVTAYTPGPNTILSMRNAARYGFKKSYVFNLGLLFGSAAVLFLCAVFSALFFTLMPKIKLPMQIAGALYILFLAWRTRRPAPQKEKQQRRGSLFAQGVLMPFINPKFYLYCITALSTYVLPYTTRPAAVAGYALILLLIAFTGGICWALFGHAFQRVMEKHARVFNIVMALLLVYCAVSLFL